MRKTIFKGQYHAGKAIGKQEHLIDNIETTQDILEGVEGEDGIEVDKLNPKNWKIRPTKLIGGGLPAGFQEKTLRVWTEDGLAEITVLVKDFSIVTAPGEGNKRLVLQSSGTTICLDMVRTVQGGV